MVASSRRGFTLIEMLLALALAVVLLGMMSLGISVYLRGFEAGRADVEETQLARTLLGMIADDLRNAVPQGSKGGGGSRGSTSAPAAEGDLDETLDESAAESLFFETGLLGEVKGLYGDRSYLQVDVLRAAMIDPFEMILAPEESGRTIAAASGIRTVAYYVVGGASGGAIDATGGMTGDEMLDAAAPNLSQQGLVRQEMDRAVASYAAEQGLVEQLQVGATLLAPEVVAILFGYFDGAEWWEEWDSAARGGLPVAVEVAVALRRPGTAGDDASGALRPWEIDMLAPESGLNIYRILVRIPTAESTAGAAEFTEESLLEELGL
jgi:prepilin-type N-terminal cleavage/methylation domain-containing protein